MRRNFMKNVEDTIAMNENKGMLIKEGSTLADI
jgi:hypothetical protein